MVLIEREYERLVRLEEGLVSARVFADADVYAREQQHIFARTWLHVGHESEIPRIGDFVTRKMGEDPVIVARGRDSQVRVFLNVCRHRGRRLCNEDLGHASHFTCGYHGWTFTCDGDLTGVPFGDEYGENLDKRDFGLIQARVAAYRGLIFATFNPLAPTLSEFLSGSTWMLDLMLGRTERVEVLGEPMRWIADANWKLGAGNFAGDGAHLATTHGFATALKLKQTRSARSSFGVDFGNGHVGSVTGFSQTRTDEALQYVALPSELHSEIERCLAPAQAEQLRGTQLIAGNLFPNLSYLNSASHVAGEWGGPADLPISFLTLRQWQPLGPDKMEVWSWLYVDATAPADWIERSKTCYQRVFGIAGTFEQDDVENWAEISAGLKSLRARDMWLVYRMGLGEVASSEWPGPGRGVHYPRMFTEGNERAFYQEWQRLMDGGNA